MRRARRPQRWSAELLAQNFGMRSELFAVKMAPFASSPRALPFWRWLEPIKTCFKDRSWFYLTANMPRTSNPWSVCQIVAHASRNSSTDHRRCGSRASVVHLWLSLASVFCRINIRQVRLLKECEVGCTALESSRWECQERRTMANLCSRTKRTLQPCPR